MADIGSIDPSLPSAAQEAPVKKKNHLEHDTIITIKALLDHTNYTSAEIGRRLGVSKRTIQRIKTSYALHNSPYPPRTAKIGRPRRFNAEQEDWLLAFVEQNPGTILSNMVDAMNAEFGIKVQTSTVYNTLKRRGWQKKDFSKTDRLTMTNMGDHMNGIDEDAMVAEDFAGAIDATLDETALSTAMT